MERLVIRGGRKLSGEITVKAAKNSVLPLIACAILSKEDIVLNNIPALSDITRMLDIIKSMGGKAEFNGSDIYINCKEANPVFIDPDLTCALRSSIFMLGPVLSRFRTARIGLPGGCAIGKRPIDLHLSGLSALNVKVREESGCVACDGTNLRGGTVRLRFPSVGATENLIMASALGKGETVIYNAAREPEIVDLQNFINFLGGRVSGAGTARVSIEGVRTLSGGAYRPFADRIAAPTFLAAVAAAKGDVTVRGVDPDSFMAVTDVFKRAGCRVKTGGDYVSLASDKRLNAVPRVKTLPYPGFPTDMQAQVTAMLSMADGESVIEETVFESRFQYADELGKMGADIRTIDRKATVRGVKSLFGAKLTAADLRGGAALVIAALAADGESEVSDVFHIDRGYDRIEETFAGLGADIKRVTE